MWISLTGYRTSETNFGSGSPPWTRFELLRLRTGSARTESSLLVSTTSAPIGCGHPDWVPKEDQTRTSPGLCFPGRIEVEQRIMAHDLTAFQITVQTSPATND